MKREIDGREEEGREDGSRRIKRSRGGMGKEERHTYRREKRGDVEEKFEGKDVQMYM